MKMTRDLLLLSCILLWMFKLLHNPEYPTQFGLPLTGLQGAIQGLARGPFEWGYRGSIRGLGFRVDIDDPAS